LLYFYFLLLFNKTNSHENRSFGASPAKTLSAKLATYAANLFVKGRNWVLDLNDYDTDIYC
jgi:hypothetical protein